MKRLLPCSVYDIPAMEGWLSEQARQGRLLTGFWGGYAADFEKGEPRSETYRLEPGDGTPRPGEEKREVFRAAGWEWCCTTANDDLWVFRACRPDPVPIHTDPETQGIAFARLQKRLRRRGIPSMLLFLILIGLYGWTLLHLSLQTLVETAYLVFQPIYWLTYGLVFFFWMCGDLRAMRRVVKPLKAGVPLDHDGAPGGHRRALVRTMAVVLAVYVVGGLALAARDTGFESWPDVRECSRPLPYVSVETLGAEPENPAASANWREGDLASDIYWVWDGDIVGTEPVLWNGKEMGTTSVKQSRTQTYRLRLSVLSGPLLREIRKEELPPAAKKVENSPFDECWYGTDKSFQYLALRQGRWVLWTRAQVPEDLRDHLEDFSAALVAMET